MVTAVQHNYDKKVQHNYHKNVNYQDQYHHFFPTPGLKPGTVCSSLDVPSAKRLLPNGCMVPWAALQAHFFKKSPFGDLQ